MSQAKCIYYDLKLKCSEHKRIASFKKLLPVHFSIFCGRIKNVMPKVHMESKNMADVFLTKKFLWLPPFLPGQGGNVRWDGYFCLVEFFS